MIQWHCIKKGSFVHNNNVVQLDHIVFRANLFLLLTL